MATEDAVTQELNPEPEQKETGVQLILTIRPDPDEVFVVDFATSLTPVPVQVVEAAAAFLQRQISVSAGLAANGEFQNEMNRQMQLQMRNQQQAERQSASSALVLPEMNRAARRASGRG